MMFFQTIDSPTGPLTITASDKAITGIRFEADSGSNPNVITQMAAVQLSEYFQGNRVTFELPLEVSGTEFQESVWGELLKIPSGETVSYAYVAQKIGKPKAARAVGGAVGANPIPIIIPCHRVMASNGAITGYSGGNGIQTKQKLLDHEARG